MNIFYLDRDPRIAATYHCDKHVVKMVTESAQLLSSVHREVDGASEDDIPHLYRLTHKGNPLLEWLKKSKDHYDWLYALFANLCREYTRRYSPLTSSKIHLTQLKLMHSLKNAPQGLQSRGFVDPPALTKEYSFDGDDAVEIYRSYYIVDKHGMFSWKTRTSPYWINTQKPLSYTLN